MPLIRQNPLHAEPGSTQYHHSNHRHPHRAGSVEARSAAGLGRAASLLALLAVGSACSPPPDPGAQVAPDAAACRRIGQACRLGPGRLGVCEATDNAQQPFRCSTQH
jgi:hypothetical protein